MQEFSTHRLDHTSAGYRPEIDGLRAVAVVAVIAHHFSALLLPGGFLGVDIFFVISGYVITRSMDRHRNASFQDVFLGFYTRRIKRLVPALIFCIFVTAFVGALFIFVSPESPEYSYSLVAGIYSLLGISNLYFLMQSTNYFYPSAKTSLFMHTWSLGVEEQFYILFPALYWFSSRMKGQGLLRVKRPLFVMIAALAVVSFGFWVWLNRASPDRAFFLMPARFWELGAGCLVAVAARSDVVRISKVVRLGGPWLAASSMVAALMLPVSSQLYTTPLVVVATCAMIATMAPGHHLFRLLSSRTAVLIGAISYSLYLWHWPVLSISRWTIGISWWTAPFQLTLMLAFALLSYLLVERPLRRAQWSQSRLVTVAIGVFALFCTASILHLLNTRFEGTLYTGVPARLAAKGVETLLDEKLDNGRLLWRARACVLTADHEVGKAIDSATCMLQPTPTLPTRRFVVIGNSYSAAEFEMYSVLSELGHGSVVATSTWGASPVPDITNVSPWSKVNEYYWRTIVPRLVDQLSEGDVVIAINDLQELTPTSWREQDIEKLSQLESGLRRLAAQLETRGVIMIFQTANPPIRDAQCSPDMARTQWFTLGRKSPVCIYTTRHDALKRRERLAEVLGAVERQHSNFHVLDLFPVMCPDEMCGIYNSDDVPLYRDRSSHSSIEANYLARSQFLRAVGRAIERSQSDRGKAR